MGLEVLEEFRPVTPIRTISIARSINHGTELSDPAAEETKKILPLDDDDEEDQCHTPKSPTHSTLKLPLECPPAPKKPRPARRKLSPPPQGFFQVPHDLASVFMALPKPSKRIRTS